MRIIAYVLGLLVALVVGWAAALSGNGREAAGLLLGVAVGVLATLLPASSLLTSRAGGSVTVRGLSLEEGGHLTGLLPDGRRVWLVEPLPLAVEEPEPIPARLPALLPWPPGESLGA